MGRKEPGTEGFWRVWGACWRDLRAGDVLMAKNRDTDEVGVDYVAEVLEPRMGRFRYVDQNGVTMSCGMLAPIEVLRWETKNTLSRYAF